MRRFRDRRDRSARRDDGDRGRHRRAQRDGDAHRASGALRPVAAAPAARARRPRRRGVVLHPARRREPGVGGASRASSRAPKTGSRSRAPICACAAWATCSASGRAASPTFRIADPLRDEVLNERARAAAAKLLARDPRARAGRARRTAPRARRALRAVARAVSRRLGGCRRRRRSGATSRFLIRSSSALAFASSSFSRLISASLGRLRIGGLRLSACTSPGASWRVADAGRLFCAVRRRGELVERRRSDRRCAGASPLRRCARAAAVGEIARRARPAPPSRRRVVRRIQRTARASTPSRAPRRAGICRRELREHACPRRRNCPRATSLCAVASVVGHSAWARVAIVSGRWKLTHPPRPATTRPT